jgi:hypothetical protein
MAKYTVAATQSGAKTSARGPSLTAAAGVGLRIVEVGVESTTAVASQVALRKITALGTGGAALDEVPWWENSAAASGVAANSSTADHTFVSGSLRVAHLPAAIGGGIIWTFGPLGLVIPEGTGNGIALTLPGGSDAIVNFYIDWEE